MLHYTARNGTTFHFDPQYADSVQVTGSDHEGPPLPLDVDDLREFVQHLEDQPPQLCGEDYGYDADVASVGPD
jgi:hypothetical protein